MTLNTLRYSHCRHAGTVHHRHLRATLRRRLLHFRLHLAAGTRAARLRRGRRRLPDHPGRLQADLVLHRRSSGHHLLRLTCFRILPLARPAVVHCQIRCLLYAFPTPLFCSYPSKRR